MAVYLNDSRNQTHIQNSTDNIIIPAHVRSTGFFVLAGCLYTTGTVGNLIFIFSFGVEKKMRTVSNFFIFMLALGDLVGCQGFTLTFITMVSQKHPVESCVLWVSCMPLYLSVSMFSQLLISMDRCIRITFRVRVYRTLFNKKLAILYSACGWILHVLVISLIYSFGQHPQSQGRYYCSSFAVLTPIHLRTLYTYSGFCIPYFLIAIVFYGCLVHHVCRHRVTILHIKRSYINTSLTLLSLCVYSILTIVLPSMFGYLSAFVLTDRGVSQIVKEIGEIVAFSGVSINPILYCYAIKEFRQSVKELFGLIRKSRVQSIAYNR